MLAVWSSGMILRLGRRGRRFESANGPCVLAWDLQGGRTMSAVGFEPTRISPPELESGALDRSAKLT